MNAYLAPEQPRWPPRTEQDITDAIEGGLIAETHYFDAKREVGPSSGDRKELGRDLASFAIDGGALLIGLAELKEERTWRLAPQLLEGLAERVEQIATQLVDPPLFRARSGHSERARRHRGLPVHRGPAKCASAAHARRHLLWSW